MTAMLFCLVWQNNAFYLLVYTKEGIKIKIPLSADIMPFTEVFKGKQYMTLLFVCE
jgi:hypothetical protein